MGAVGGRASRWFSRQIDEIRSDRALTLYGVALAAANVFTSLQWQFRSGVSLMIGRGNAPLCWPFWEECDAVRLSVWSVHYLLWGFLFLSLLAGGCFLFRKVAAGYWLLVLVNAVRLLIMIQDYRLRANQHYMLNWIVLAFLFLPGKRVLLHHLLVSLYFWAGILKLDWEWLSGVALYNQDRLWLPAALVPASCVYVVVLETTLVFGLYGRRNWIFYATLAQLLLFHLFSWPIVGFWYPMLMLCLLSILPMTRLFDPPSEWVTFSWTPSRTRGLLNAVVLGSFALLQMVPRAFPGDTAVTGEGRVFALHMFDALIECDAKLTYHFTDGTAHDDALEETSRLPHRSRCDPIIFFDIAKNNCRRRLPGVVDLDLSLRSRHSADPEYHQTIDIRNFCATNPTYDMWRHNTWILH
jgi:hypothetical protein